MGVKMKALYRIYRSIKADKIKGKCIINRIFKEEKINNRINKLNDKKSIDKSKSL